MQRPPPRVPKSRTIRRAVLSAVALVCFSPQESRAMGGDPEFRLGVTGGYSMYADERRYHGIGAALELQYAVDSTWVIGGRYAYGAHAMRGAEFQLQQFALGVRYQLDVFEYVPWLELAPGAYLKGGHGGPAEDLTMGVRAGLGFERRFNEFASLGFGAHYHQLFGESRFPAYLEIHLGALFHFDLGDSLAP